MTGPVDEGTAVDIVYLDFRKAFDTVFHKILREHVNVQVGLAVMWIESCLNSWAQRLISGTRLVGGW